MGGSDSGRNPYHRRLGGIPALEFQDSGTPGTVIAQTPLLAAAGLHTSPDIGEGVVLAAAENTLKLDVSATSTVSGMVFGVEE